LSGLLRVRTAAYLFFCFSLFCFFFFFGNEHAFETSSNGKTLYVAGLSLRTTEDELLSLFKQHGKVNEVRIVLDPRTRESRGFGFVTMETNEQAATCVEKVHRSSDNYGMVLTVEVVRIHF